MSLIDDLESAEDWRTVLANRGDVIYLQHNILTMGRWTHRVRMVVSVDGKYYAIETDEPNTENDDVDDEDATFYEVQPVTKTVHDYVPVPKALEADW